MTIRSTATSSKSKGKHPTLHALLRPFKAPCLLPRRKRTLWTQPHMVRPAYVKAKFGDGKRLIGLMPIMHRPNYYLVWIGSDWETSNGGDQWLDRLEDIWEAIAEEFGSRDRDSETYDWPEEDSSGGCSWFDADADDVLTQRQRRRLHAQ